MQLELRVKAALTIAEGRGKEIETLADHVARCKAWLDREITDWDDQFQRSQRLDKVREKLEAMKADQVRTLEPVHDLIWALWYEAQAEAETDPLWQATANRRNEISCRINALLYAAAPERAEEFEARAVASKNLTFESLLRTQG